ncbi:hypothetical protein QUG92_12250 [Curtobacterium sp. RHCKG23]|uniref:Bacterial Ig domain-containing protein n=1 Tax=Curtobacterium citri TaxID=3055139 RepID=A0ABT7T8H3_9MICO|nr:hypothetical protein [Curtobacterium citri]MDM7885879.1 hypothetical protein [Curtobacterium citri]
MNLRPLAVGSAVVLASCLAVGATSASAFAAPGQHARAAASSASTARAGITDVQQAPMRVGDLQWVDVRVTVDAPTVVRLIDPSGEIDDAKSGDSRKPIVFQVKPNGQDSAHYAVDTGQSSTERAVDVDFSGLPLSAPLDLSSEGRLTEISRAVQHGQLIHEMRYEAVPGAEVTVVANGHSTAARASDDGVATVSVEFRGGENQVRASQVLGEKRSLESDDHYTFGGSDGGTGGGSDGGSGGGSGSGEQVDPASLRLDQQQGAELTPKDGKVTLSGRASGGWITVRDLDNGSQTTTEVRDGHWSIDVPATKPGGRIASIALSGTEQGAPVARTTLRYVVRDDSQQPGDGNEMPATELSVDQSGSVQLDRDGFVTYTGTAPGESVLVLENGKRAGEFAVKDGHFAAKIYQTPGKYKLTFLAKEKPHGSLWNRVTTTEVTVEG